MKIKSLCKVVCFFGLISGYSLAAAWDGSATGKIVEINVTHGENLGFRVFLEGMPSLCTNGHNWAYLNQSFSNYNAYVSALLAAKMASATVQLYTNHDASGYCKIEYISVK